MVRLLLAGQLGIDPNLPGFNPTMVRLLRRYVSSVGVEVEWFQSHNGAIAAPFIRN